MGYNRPTKKMKKFLIICCALFSFTIAANACKTPAFSGVYESIEVDYSSTYSNVKINGEYYAVRKNPYANSKSCAPDMNWATCYEFCFSYNGKTYFFNPC